jgi:8-oxo-dGTP pyrophosphatase MutT (NUDIX family)
MKFGKQGKYLNCAIPIIRNSKGEVLIVKRKDPIESTDGVFHWHFPGAIVEDVEDLSPVTSFVSEETGYLISPKEVISERDNHPLGHHNIYVEFELASTEPKDKLKKEVVEEYAWVKPVELGDYFTSNIDFGVAEFLGLNI